MKKEIKVPSAGESITEAHVANLIKQSGAQVNKDDEVVELETDKVNQVVYAPDTGLLEITVKVGDTVRVGQVIGYVETSEQGTKAPEDSKNEAPQETPELQPAKDKTPAPEPVTPKSTPEPSAQAVRQPKEAFMDSLSTGSSPKPAAQPQQTVAKEPAHTPVTLKEGQERKPMSRLRQTIAKRLVEVKNQTAMLTTFNEVDMTEIMEFRVKEKDKFQKKHGVKLGFMSFFVKACCQALKELPDVNAFIDGNDIIYNSTFDIGISVSTDKGLLVPVVKDCAQKSFAEIEGAIIDYANKARSGGISVDDLKGGTFTITNGGVFGSLLSTPILNPPQSAILGMHNIVKRPIAVNDQVVIRPMMYIALSYDHRIIDGKEAVTFLVKVKECLEEPSRILVDV